MPNVIHIFCDESCHLPNDSTGFMTLGALWCPKEEAKSLSKDIRNIKARHGIAPATEIKWTKVSPGKVEFYLELIEFFFATKSLHSRVIVIDKSQLKHKDFNQDHDSWYYKMYFVLLRQILEPSNEYRIFIDSKDTCSNAKIEKLHKILNNSKLDFDSRIVRRIQSVHSEEIVLLQLIDLIIGAIAYENRDLSSSAAKLAIVARLKELSGYSLRKSTLPKETKLNMLHWQGRRRPDA